MVSLSTLVLLVFTVCSRLEPMTSTALRWLRVQVLHSMEVVPLLVPSILSQRNQPLSHLLMVTFSLETLASRAIRVLDLYVITTLV